MKSPLPLLLIMSSVLFAQPANFQKPSFNNPTHSNNKTTRTINKNKFEFAGPIKVFFKKAHSDGSKIKEFTAKLKIKEKQVTHSYGQPGDVALSLMQKSKEFAATYSSKIEIENQRNDIRPWDTDSIEINGKIGYPEDDSKVWYFKQEQKRITVYSAHPEEEVGLKLRLSNGKLQPLPSKLTTTSEGSAFTTTIDKFAFADSLAQNPRLFVEYEYRCREMILLYNALPDSLLQNEADQDTIANLTRKLFEKAHKRVKPDDVDELLKRDSKNSFALICKAELLLNSKNIPEAQKYLELAKDYSPFEDFHIHRLRAMIFEKQGNTDAAIDAYALAIKGLSWYSQNYRNRYEKDLYKRVEKLY